MEGDISQSLFHSEVSWRQDLYFRTEVEVRASGWLFFVFLVFRLNPSIYPRVFINCVAENESCLCPLEETRHPELPGRSAADVYLNRLQEP